MLIPSIGYTKLPPYPWLTKQSSLWMLKHIQSTANRCPGKGSKPSPCELYRFFKHSPFKAKVAVPSHIKKFGGKIKLLYTEKKECCIINLLSQKGMSGKLPIMDLHALILDSCVPVTITQLLYF